MCEHWRLPTNYSAVKLAKIRYHSEVTSESELIDQIFDIKLDKNSDEISVGKVIQVGSRAKMSKLAADLAEEASNVSLMEVDSTDRLRKRKNQSKQKVPKKNKPSLDEDGVTDGDDPITMSTQRDTPEVQVEDGAVLLEISQPDDTSQCFDSFATGLDALKAQLIQSESVVQDLRLKLKAKDRTI